MAATAEPAPLELGKMTKIQKIAALLVILGPESAAQVLKGFDEHDLETISGEMAKISLLDRELQAGILREFSDVAVQASTGIRGGVDCAQNTLEKAVGLFRATDIIGRVAPSRTPVASMEQISQMEPRQIFNLIKQEQPQTIALVLSYLPPEKSSGVLAQLRAEHREQVIERLATMAPTPIEVVEQVVAVLTTRVGGKHTRALNQTGGIKTAAAVLNAMDKNVSKSLLVALEERVPELGQAIRHKMFTFEDLSTLDVPSLQKIMREVDMRDLAVSLKTASEKVKTALLGSISKRAAETVAEEIAFMGPLKLRDIEAAQMRVIEILRRLEGEGEIDLGDNSEKSTNEALA
ncbi:MAG TPA: flagellar motor switch protein FliG [Verrucomicrobiae bacterium]|nr:flagellar motor switch protein FliG [Verrucomicrobiae bacterium]